jgi:putative membrane protein
VVSEHLRGKKLLKIRGAGRRGSAARQVLCERLNIARNISNVARAPNWNLLGFGRVHREDNSQECALNRMLLSLGTATLMAISIANASAKDKQSETFLKKAIEGNFAEVSMGELAQQNGQSDAVKSYGRMLSTDHAAANQKALDAARGLGMTAPSGPNAKQKAEHDKMSKVSGAGFDRMFATHMVADHQTDIAEYKKASKSKDVAGEYASGQIDTLQKHLDTAKSLKADN